MKRVIVAAALLGLFGASAAVASEPIAPASTVKIETVGWRTGYYGGYGYARPYRWGGYYRPYGWGYGYRPYRAYYGGYGRYGGYGGYGGGWGGGYYPYGGGFYTGFGVY